MQHDDRPWLDRTHDLSSEDALREVYRERPGATSLHKEADHVHPRHRPYIETAPLAALATPGPRGLDTSPPGDAPGLIAVADAPSPPLPDRRGRNRTDRPPSTAP